MRSLYPQERTRRGGSRVSDQTALDRLLATIQMHRHDFSKDSAHVEIHGNKVLGTHLVDGLRVESEDRAEGVYVHIVVEENRRIEKPVYFCFGMLEKGLQKIDMDVDFEANSSAKFISHCTFSEAGEGVQHLMD